MHRGWMRSPDFRPEPFSEREAFLWSIEKAAFEPHEQWFNGTRVKLLAGQLVTSLRAMSDEFQWPVKRVRLFLQRMERVQKWAHVGAHGGTVITVCNYAEYQLQDEREGTPKDKPRAHEGHTRGTQDKKEKKEKKDIPNGISGAYAAPQPEWSEYAKHRKDIGKPLTPRAVQLALGTLERLQGEGHDPRKVINQSIENRWTGLFPVKERKNGNDNGQGDRTLRAAERAFGPASGWTDDRPF
jgi:hypothetical protein